MTNSPFGLRFGALTATLALISLAAGCGDVKSAPPPAAYGREGASIAQARSQRQQDVQERAQQEASQRSEAQQRQIAAATQQAVADAQRSATPAPGQIKHIVVMWLKKPGDAAARQAVLDAGRTMKTIPGVIDVVGGEVITSDRAVVDSTYDIAFVMTFADAEALKAYGPHPIHQKLVEEVVKPNVERYLVYDISVR